MKARHLPRTADLYADVLEPGISARDECTGEFTIVARNGFSAAQVDIARDGVGGTCSLGHDRLRLRPLILAELSRVDGSGSVIQLS